MKPVKVLVLILLAFGLIRYNQSLSGADAKSGDPLRSPSLSSDRKSLPSLALKKTA